MITLPASAVPEALAECGAKGVKAAAIISSGFAEVGGEGVRLQEELHADCSRVWHRRLRSQLLRLRLLSGKSDGHPLAWGSMVAFRKRDRQPS